MACPVVTNHDIGEQREKGAAVVVVAEQRLSGDATGRYVEGAAGHLESQRSRHAPTLVRGLYEHRRREAFVTERREFCGGV